MTHETAVATPLARSGSRSSFSAAARAYGVWATAALMVVYGFVAVPNFASHDNFSNIAGLLPALALLALGQTFVIAVGGLDLSVGSLVSLVGVLAVGSLSGDPGRLVLAVAIGLVVGVGVGIVNGSLIVATGIHPMILTFGMLTVLSGLTYLYTDQSIGGAPANFITIATGTVLGVPLPIILLAAAVCTAWIVLHRTRFGRHLQAVGKNEANARRAGIGIGRIKIAAYAISGLFAGAAGLVLAARLGAGYPLAGQGMELDAVVAVMLGGTPFGGGRATILGSLAGAVVLTLLAVELNLMNVTPYLQQVIKGALVVIAIAFYSQRRRSA